VNARTAAEVVRAHADADIVVFPELFLSGYVLDGLADVATDVDGPEFRIVRDAAAEARTIAIVGFVEPVAGGFANSAACIDRSGHVVGVYRKVFLFGAETDAFVVGDELVVADVDGVRIAPLICFDVEFPEASRAAAVAGAELLVTISANMQPYYHDHLLHSRARALENRLPHLYVNRVGRESGFAFVGGSRSISPTGDVVAAAEHDSEELVRAQVAPRAGFDDSVDYLRFLRVVPPVRHVARSAGPRPTEVDVAP
jgi:predicted amidohydrolase